MVRLRMITLLCSRMRNPPSKISASSSTPMMDLSEVTSIVSPNGSISMVPSTRMVYGSSASAYSASSSCVVTVTVAPATRPVAPTSPSHRRDIDRLPERIHLDGAFHQDGVRLLRLGVLGQLLLCCHGDGLACRAARGAVQSLAGKSRKTDRLVGPLGCGDLGGDLLTGGGL